MSNQPEALCESKNMPTALRLADALDRWHEGVFPCEAAEELRRPHAVNQEVLEALKQALEECIWPNERLSDVHAKARAAIAKAEGEKT
jgi:hypothetical protein